MAQDTPLGFPARTLPYRCGKPTTLSTVSHPRRYGLRGCFHTECGGFDYSTRPAVMMAME